MDPGVAPAHPERFHASAVLCGVTEDYVPIPSALCGVAEDGGVLRPYSLAPPRWGSQAHRQPTAHPQRFHPSAVRPIPSAPCGVAADGGMRFAFPPDVPVGGASARRLPYQGMKVFMKPIGRLMLRFITAMSLLMKPVE